MAPKSPILGVERALRVVEPCGQFRHQEMDVGVALTMGVGRFVDRHVVDVGREIRAVVQVEASNQDWFALPSPEWTVTTSPGTVSNSCPMRKTGRGPAPPS